MGVVSGGGGGGSVLTPDANFCYFGVAPTVTLTPGAAFYTLTPADLSIASQSGTDYSIGNSGDFPPLGNSGAIISAGGGWFTAACYIGAPVGVTLDAGSIEARWLEVFYSIGFALDNPFGLTAPSGVDFALPVGPAYGDVADLRVSVPMYSAPGHPVLHNFGVEFVNGFGTDAISAPLGNTGNMVLWQVA